MGISILDATVEDDCLFVQLHHLGDVCPIDEVLMGIAETFEGELGALRSSTPGERTDERVRMEEGPERRPVLALVGGETRLGDQRRRSAFVRRCLRHTVILPERPLGQRGS